MDQKHDVVEIKDVTAEPQRFARLVEQNMNVAVRVAHLVSRMRPAEMCKAREVTLSLPTELLATLWEKCPFVFEKTHKATAKRVGKGEADAFRELRAEKLGTSDGRRGT